MRLALLAVLLVGCAAPSRNSLVSHSNKGYSLRVPQGARFKSQILTLDKAKLNGELWDSGDEGGIVGVADLPLMRASAASTYNAGNSENADLRTNQGLGRALSDDEMVQTFCQAQIKAFDGEVGEQKDLNKLGNRSRQVDFSVPGKKIQGRGVYMWGNRRLYYCLYASQQSFWDEARAQSVLNSFRFSRR